MEDLRHELLKASDHTTHCPFKDDASYYFVRVGDRVAENAIWFYPVPLESYPALNGYAAFYWRKMDIRNYKSGVGLKRNHPPNNH